MAYHCTFNGLPSSGPAKFGILNAEGSFGNEPVTCGQKPPEVGVELSVSSCKPGQLQLPVAFHSLQPGPLEVRGVFPRPCGLLALQAV